MNRVRALLLRALISLVSRLRGTTIGRVLRPLGKIADRFMLSLMKDQEFTVHVNGYQLLLPGRSVANVGDAFTLSFLLTNTWEPGTTMLFRRLVREGMNVIDVGAHVGYYTLLASRLVGQSGKVFAFEPEPRNYSFLLRNIELNACSNVTAIHKAVSHGTDRVKLYRSKVNPSGHTLGKMANGDYIDCVDVDAVSIDEFLKDMMCSVHVIKIDVEGAEVLVLRGMRETCTRLDKVKLFIEFCPTNLARFGTDSGQYWDTLMELGFRRIFLIDESNKKLRPATLEAAVRYVDVDQSHSVNLLCLK